MITQVKLMFDNGDIEETDDLLSFQSDRNFTSVISIEGRADTRELSLSYLSGIFPNIEKLRLNNSILQTIRDISSQLLRLRFLWLSNCGITELSGITTISKVLEELYLSSNKITELADLIGLDQLKILDLEDNLIEDISQVEFLSCLPSLKALTLQGNQIAQNTEYKVTVARLVPKLTYLDEKRLRPKPPRPDGITPKEQVPKERLVITEMVEDTANMRPPSARGTSETKLLGSNWLSKPLGKPLVPKITRPVSSYRARSSHF